MGTVMPQSYENYVASLELPEECPVCGYANADDDGEPLFVEDPSFCSERCMREYEVNQRFLDDILYIDYLDMQAEHR